MSSCPHVVRRHEGFDGKTTPTRQSIVHALFPCAAVYLGTCVLGGNLVFRRVIHRWVL